MIWVWIWIKKSRMTNHTLKYTILIDDVNNQQISLDGLRTSFQNNDVAWSFMKEYKEMYLCYNFGLASTGKNPNIKQ